MTQKLSFRLVCPEEILFSDEVTMAVLPGEEGDFGVLFGHASLISTLRRGLVHIYQEKALIHEIYVDGGFAHVNEKGCWVMTEESFFLKDFDPEKLEMVIQEKLKELEKAHSQEEQEALRQDLHVANAKLQIIGKNLHGR